jgi:hypothetical protein
VLEPVGSESERTPFATLRALPFIAQGARTRMLSPDMWAQGQNRRK